MAEIQVDVRGLSKPARYITLKDQLEAVCDGVSDPIAVMATMASLLHLGFGHLWTGFYRRVGPTTLIIGPYQGAIGCMDIQFGRGVCGTAAATRRTLIVPDVSAFPGHIACDSRSRSEIVVPIFDDRNDVTAVLDIDSAELAAFDVEDGRQLQSWADWFTQHTTRR